MYEVIDIFSDLKEICLEMQRKYILINIQCVFQSLNHDHINQLLDIWSEQYEPLIKELNNNASKDSIWLYEWIEKHNNIFNKVPALIKLSMFNSRYYLVQGIRNINEIRLINNLLNTHSTHQMACSIYQSKIQKNEEIDIHLCLDKIISQYSNQRNIHQADLYKINRTVIMEYYNNMLQINQLLQSFNGISNRDLYLKLIKIIDKLSLNNQDLSMYLGDNIRLIFTQYPNLDIKELFILVNARKIDPSELIMKIIIIINIGTFMIIKLPHLKNKKKTCKLGKLVILQNKIK